MVSRGKEKSAQFPPGNYIRRRSALSGGETVIINGSESNSATSNLAETTPAGKASATSRSRQIPFHFQFEAFYFAK